MNLIISLIYAPLVFISLRYFDIKSVSIFIIVFSLVWLLLSLRTKLKEYYYPLFYLVLGSITYYLEEFLILKSMPLIISITITFVIITSYITKKSVILYFAKKFTNKKISEKEQNYIHKSTLFWIVISCINICFHLSVFLSDEISFWIYYSSIGWYILFAIAGILQYLHRKFVFLKEIDV